MKYKLGDFISIKHGYAFKGEHIVSSDNGIVLVTPGNFQIGGGFKEDKCKYFDGEYPDEYVLRPGDLIVTMTDLSKAVDTLGFSALVPDTNRIYLHNQRIGLVRIERDGLDKDFLYWLMRTPNYQKTIAATSTGSTVHHTSPTRIQEYSVDIPEFGVQKRIASVLNGIEHKISTNNAINDNLQQQAQTFFANLFALQHDGIPEGWKRTTMGDMVTIQNKSFNPVKSPEILLEHYSIPAFDEMRYPVFELSTGIKSNKFIIDEGCFLISKLNPTTKRVWRPICMTGNAVCSTEFIVYKANEPKMTEFLYSLIDSAEFSDFMCSHVTGSTGSRQRTTPSDTLQYTFYLPTEEEIYEFSTIVAPMYAQIKVNAMENARLTQLRDSLLPRLMSGEIDVSDVQI